MRTARRSIMIPPPLWAALGERAEAETERRGYAVYRADLAREAIERLLGIDYRQDGSGGDPYAELDPDRLDADNAVPAGAPAYGGKRLESDPRNSPHRL